MCAILVTLDKVCVSIAILRSDFEHEMTEEQAAGEID
jgi:hypothetical protein